MATKECVIIVPTMEHDTSPGFKQILEKKKQIVEYLGKRLIGEETGPNIVVCNNALTKKDHEVIAKIIEDLFVPIFIRNDEDLSTDGDYIIVDLTKENEEDDEMD